VSNQFAMRVEIGALKDEIYKPLEGKNRAFAVEALTQTLAECAGEAFGFEGRAGQEAIDKIYKGICTTLMEIAVPYLPKQPVHEAPDGREDYALAELRWPKRRAATAGK
jgi:hypothetical protein